MGKGSKWGLKPNFLKFRYKKIAFFVFTSGFAWRGSLELFGLRLGRKKNISFAPEQTDSLGLTDASCSSACGLPGRGGHTWRLDAV